MQLLSALARCHLRPSELKVGFLCYRAFASQAIEVRSVDLATLAAEALHVAVAEIVRQNEDDIGRRAFERIRT